MRKVLLGAALLSFLTASAIAGPVSYYAVLDGPSEAPPNASPGTGFATLVIDSTAHTLFLNTYFSGLLGGVTAAHIHVSSDPFKGTGFVATRTPSFPSFPAGVKSGSYKKTFDTTLASSFGAAFITSNGGTVAGAEAALFGGIAGGRAYLNIHTSSFTGGEIRGFFVPVPEPGSWAMLSAGLAGLMVIRARRRRA